MARNLIKIYRQPEIEITLITLSKVLLSGLLQSIFGEKNKGFERPL